MGPVLALKYFRYTYRPSKINILQQAERLGGPILSLGSIEPQSRSIEKEVSPLSITQSKNRNPVYEPLLSDSPNSTRRSFGPGTPFDFFQSQSRLASSSYSRNCKTNWFLFIHSPLNLLCIVAFSWASNAVSFLYTSILSSVLLGYTSQAFRKREGKGNLAVVIASDKCYIGEIAIKICHVRSLITLIWCSK